MSQDSIINQFVNNLPFELHLWSPDVGKYSACGPGTKHRARIDEFIRTGDVDLLYKNTLDKACFYHDSSYSKVKDVPARQAADKQLMDRSLKIAGDTTLDGYQRALAAAIYNFFDKKIQLGQGLSRTQQLKLKTTYYDPTSGFSSVRKLAEQTKLPRREVVNWLERQAVYSKHKRYNSKHKTRRVMVRYKDAQWQSDLVDVRALSASNERTGYILTIVDLFSKFAWGLPIKRKTGDEITRAFKTVFKERQPERIQTDRGSEFINKNTQALFASKNIKWFATQNENKAQTVERFNSSLQQLMYRYFTANKTKRWLEVLPKLMENYNNSYHRSIKMTPVEASKAENESAVWESLYGSLFPLKKTKPTFQVGDTVRIFKHRGKFKRGYTANFTNEWFRVSEVLQTAPPTYRLVDSDGEEIIGAFYAEELSRFIPG